MRTIILLLALVCFGVGGCSTGKSGREINDLYKPALEKEQTYRIQPGDLIAITFLRAPDYNQENLRVRSDGYVSTPYGPFLVAGLTPDEAAEDIEDKVTHVRNPSLTVQVTEPAARYVWVIGEVRAPGQVEFKPGITGLEAVASVGGNLETGKMREIMLIRYADQQSRAIHRVNFKDRENPLLLLPRDIVFIPRTGIGNANAVMRLYIRNMLPFGPGAPIPL